MHSAPALDGEVRLGIESYSRNPSEQGTVGIPAPPQGIPVGPVSSCAEADPSCSALREKLETTRAERDRLQRLLVEIRDAAGYSPLRYERGLVGRVACLAADSKRYSFICDNADDWLVDPHGCAGFKDEIDEAVDSAISAHSAHLCSFRRAA